MVKNCPRSLHLWRWDLTRDYWLLLITVITSYQIFCKLQKQSLRSRQPRQTLQYNLRSKRFQSSYCAKVRAGAKKRVEFCSHANFFRRTCAETLATQGIYHTDNGLQYSTHTKKLSTPWVRLHTFGAIKNQNQPLRSVEIHYRLHSFGTCSLIWHAQHIMCPTYPVLGD